jgi:hypothetical protein
MCMIAETDASFEVGPCQTGLSGTDPLISADPAPTCAACVVIPARDEAEVIERTLAALADQRGFDDRPVDPATFEVILLANNCQDETAAVARRWAACHGGLTLHVIERDLPPGHANVGYARRLAMDEACRRLLAVGRARGVIASTDADTIVSPRWLVATRHEVERGAEAVGGRILVAQRERQAMARPVRSRFLRNVGYWALVDEVMARVDPRPTDPWPRHEQFFGASLAVTARAYRRVGGLPVLPSGEDAALADALRRADIDIRHSPAVRVQTSARVDGRAPAGLAALLGTWSDLAADAPFPRVPSAATVVARATGRRALRGLWKEAQDSRQVCAAEVARLAEHANVTQAWLAHAIISADRFGALLSDFEQRACWQRPPELVDVRDAIDGLRRWLEPYRRPGTPPPTFARHLPGLPYLPSIRRSLHIAAPTRPVPASAALEQVEAVAKAAMSLAQPPQVA